MPDSPLTWEDLKVFEPDIPEDLANAMIATVWSRAQKLATCLTAVTPDPNPLDDDVDRETVKDILRSAVLRWNDSGSGAVTSRTAGDYSENFAHSGGGLFRPGEIADLRSLCGARAGQKASTILTSPSYDPFVEHAAWCSVSFGGTFCDCGAELSFNGLPLWTRP